MRHAWGVLAIPISHRPVAVSLRFQEVLTARDTQPRRNIHACFRPLHAYMLQPSTTKVQLAIASTAEKTVELPGFEAFMKVNAVNSSKLYCR